MEIFEKCFTLTALTTTHTMKETKATMPNITDQKILSLDNDQTEGGTNTETEDGKGQILHCSHCGWVTGLLKSSKARQKLKPHVFRHLP